MKKFLVILLAVALVLAMAACGNGGEEDTDELPEPVVTPTDLDEEYVPDPTETADNETFVSDYAQAAARLGLESITFPEGMEIYRVLLVDEDKVQVEFYHNDKLYLGQYVVGMVDNPSGLKGLFENVESVELSGENVNFEYPTLGEDGSSTTLGKDHALAQTYDAETNITAWLVDNGFTDLDDFKAVTELFLNALDPAPEQPEATAEEAPTEEAPAEEETAN